MTVALTLAFALTMASESPAVEAAPPAEAAAEPAVTMKLSVASGLAAMEDPILHDAVVSTEGEHVEKEHLLAASVATMIVLNIISLAIGQWLHSKHIFWLPECGATILVGFFAGWWVSTHLPPDVERKETNLYFDPTFFTLFLLPPIIFDAGYSVRADGAALLGPPSWGPPRRATPRARSPLGPLRTHT